MKLKFPQQKNLLSVIIPVYNEKKTIDIILNKIISLNINKEIIIVNDGSTDETKQKLLKFRKKKIIKIINLKKNFGKGYAIRRGIEEVKGELIVIQDADLEYNPEDYYKLIRSVKLYKSKFVIGSRVLSNKIYERPNGFISDLLVIINKFFSFVTSKIVKQKITDPQSCYKLFTYDLAKKIILKENGFSFCNEIIFEVRKLGVKIYEVPISYKGRSYNEGKKINLKHGLKMLFYLIKNYLN
ncbi:glycosyltransferase family 2 protein [Candidatus Pelagibacter communis]|uniref:glycosyltransferase family 2 protein n=1 Tax=Pelagibacter ubique TaxID=198252 RepID=UPI00065B4209|nr:glycosyltransferase family 2 protein [Candidatus Pelagibacter ubique]